MQENSRIHHVGQRVKGPRKNNFLEVPVVS